MKGKGSSTFSQIAGLAAPGYAVASLVSSWKDGKWTRYQTTEAANQLLP